MKFTQVVIAFAGLFAIVSALPIHGLTDAVGLAKREPICFHGCEEPGQEGKREVEEEPTSVHEDFRFGGYENEGKREIEEEPASVHEDICFRGCDEPGQEGKREVEQEPASVHEDFRFGGIGRKSTITYPLYHRIRTNH